MDHKAKVRQNRELLRVDRLTDLTLEQLSEGIETCFPSDISRKRFLHVLCSWLGEQVSEASNMNNVPSNELFDRWCRFALNCGHDAKSINNAYEEWTREEQKANSSSPDHDHSIKALCLELAGPFIRDYLGLVGESAGNHGTNVHTYPDRTRSSQREPNPVIGNPLVKEENPIDRGVYMHPDRAKMAQRELSPTSDDHEAKLSISKIDLDGPLIKEEPMNHGSYMHPDRARLSEREPSAGIYDEEEKSPVGHLIANCPTTFDRSFDTKPPSKFVCSVCRQRGGHWPTLCPQNLHPDSITQKRLCATDSARRERERRDLKPGHGENFRLPSPLDAVPSGRRSYGYDRNYHHRRSRSRSHQGRTKVSRDCRRQRSSHYRPTSPRRGSDRREDYHRDDSKSPIKRNREDEEDELDIDSYRASRRRCLPTASKKEGRLSFYDYEDGSSLETPTSGYNNRSVSWEKTKIVRSIPDREASTFTPAKPLYRVKEKQKNRKVSWEDTELENRLSTPRIMEHRGSPQFLPRFPKQTLEELILTCSRVPIFDSVPGYKPEVDQMSSIFQQTAACEMAFFTDRPSLEEPKAMAHESLPVVKNEPITPIKREPSSPIILGVTEYTLDRDPPYDSSVLKLFKDKTVVWVRKIRRNHAEDLWGDAPEAKITTASEDPKMDEDKEAPQPISAEPQSEPVDLAMDSVMSGCDTPGLTAYESKKAPDVFRNESSRQSVPVDSGVDSGISDSSMEEGEIKESIEAESPEASNKFRN
ncbi:hypothetical protein B0T17DRAFT_613570 [Bombardia bombarda]|uniref:Zinc knuckle CX2CX3GHX4C domain-containing protein n=1 Tax=Bombardia bombarda TaxID=252184 RepID=A0AA40CG11_9PEZI|nr:hypothetical protein B0T17DRAFT_613570 [Bombardia bombarda]